MAEPFLFLRFYRIYLFSGNPKKQLLDECDYYFSVCSGSFFDIFPVCFSPSLLYSGHPNTQKRGNQVSQLCVFSLLYRTFFLYLLFPANHFFPWNSSFGSAFYCACSQSFLPSVFGCHVRLFIRIEPDTPSGKSKFPLYHRTWLRISRGENDTPPSESCR